MGLGRSEEVWGRTFKSVLVKENGYMKVVRFKSHRADLMLSLAVDGDAVWKQRHHKC